MTEQRDRITMEEKFYSKNFNFSYSGLNKLLYSPRLWYKHYILQEREERTDAHLIEGKVVHALLLDEANFNKNFIVSPMKLPSPDTKGLLDRVFQYGKDNDCLDCKLDKHTDEILRLLKEINLHQSLKTDDQRIDKIVTDGNQMYYDYLKDKEGKDILDQETFQKCKEDADLLKANDRISNLLRLGVDDKKIAVYNEQAIERALPDYPFGLKGIVDNFVVDDRAKTVYINDVKTTGKTIADFHETVEYYNYWLQAALYKELIKDMYPESYKIKFTFIVIDKYQQVYPFEVKDETMALWHTKMIDTLVVAKWHYENRKFNLPYKFENETVTL